MSEAVVLFDDFKTPKNRAHGGTAALTYVKIAGSRAKEPARGSKAD
jgi:hypothetical protein